MGRQANSDSGWRQESKRWSLIHGPCFLTVLLVISMIHVATSQSKMSTHDQEIRSPRYAKTTGKPKTQSSRVCSTTECADVANQIKSSMNLTVDPCDDFYEYACGRWHENNPRPPSYLYDVFGVVNSKTKDYKLMKLETETIKVDGTSRKILQMPSDLYKSCMNLTAIKNLGDAPLKERIRDLGGWNMSGNWDEEMWDFSNTLLSIHNVLPDTNLYPRVKGPVFRATVLPDPKDATKKGFAIWNAGTVLGKDSYLNLSSKTISNYRQRIIDLVVRLGGNPNTTAKKADEIIGFEAQLANVTPTFAEILNSYDQLRIWTLEELQREVPEFDWIHYFNNLYSSSSSKIKKTGFSMAPPVQSYLSKAMKIISSTTKSILANYLVWYTIQGETDLLSVPSANGDRWGTCVASAFESFSDVIEAGYANECYEKITGPIRIAKNIVRQISQAFKENINSLTWLDEVTRSEILEKVNGMVVNFGFPDYMLPNRNKNAKAQKKLSEKLSAKLLEKYKDISIGLETYFKNKMSISKEVQKDILKDFSNPLDKSTWIMSPFQANALYHPSYNSITLPAMILQPPLAFLSETLRSYSLGSFGTIAGHELMHGFGIVGRTFDQNGAYKKWWSNESLQELNKRTECFVKQYSSYRVLGEWNINGNKTADENIADDGALKAALKAYYNWAKKNPRETWLLPGLDFTNEQLFFIGAAQKFCSSYTRSTRQYFHLVDNHADIKFRIIVPLANSCDFTKAFKCKINSPMNPVNKCYMWSNEEL